MISRLFVSLTLCLVPSLPQRKMKLNVTNMFSGACRQSWSIIAHCILLFFWFLYLSLSCSQLFSVCLISNAFNGSLYLARGTTFRIPYSDKIQYSSVYPKGDTQRQELAPTASRVPLTDKYDCNPTDFTLRPRN